MINIVEPDPDSQGFDFSNNKIRHTKIRIRIRTDPCPDHGPDKEKFSLNKWT
jgi:hypothetical protein